MLDELDLTFAKLTTYQQKLNKLVDLLWEYLTWVGKCLMVITHQVRINSVVRNNYTNKRN